MRHWPHACEQPLIRQSPSSPTLPSYAESSLHAAASRGHPAIPPRSFSLEKQKSRHPGSRSAHVHVVELSRTDLFCVDFGSPYARQSTSAVTCALPLYNGSLVIFGSADGLSVLDTSGEAEVPVRRVWTGLAVWDIRVLRCVEDEKSGGGKTPRGSVMLLCGGQEDPKTPGQPKRKGGGVEVRVWRLGSLASLARWSAEREPGWKGLEMGPPPLVESKKAPTQAQAQGKGKGLFSAFKRTTSSDRPGVMSPDTAVSSRGGLATTVPDPGVPGVQLARAWANDWLGLVGSTTGKPADILGATHRQHRDTMYIAISTTSHILLHVGQVSPSGITFRSTRKFYLPFAPSAIGLLDVSDDAREVRGGETSLGIWVSFAGGGGGGGGAASVIRNSDSAVLDFKPPSGQGRGKSKGSVEWTGVQSVRAKGREYYAFARGSETIVYPAPLRLPISEPPVMLTAWPRTPASSLVVPDGEDLVLMTTNEASEIVTQRARPTAAQVAAKAGGWQLDMQDGAILKGARVLPLAWGYLRDGLYASVKDGEEWRICALEKQ